MRLQSVTLQIEDVGKAADFLEKLWGSPLPAPLGVLASSAAPPACRTSSRSKKARRRCAASRRFGDHAMTQPTSDLRYIAPVFRVADLARSLEFYRDRLRFQVQFVYEGMYAEVCRDDCRVHLKCGAPTPRNQTACESENNIDVCEVGRDASELWAEFASAEVPSAVPLRQSSEWKGVLRSRP